MAYEMLPIQAQTWEEKYRFKAPGGLPRLTSDLTIEATWRRIAHALAAPEGNEARLWENKFYGALEGFQFLPGGRIIAGAGTGRDVTLLNCFVLGTVPDSMEGIFQRLKDGALTMQQGGGIGTDFSTLRPNGADVHGVAARASGPVSFMDCWDAMCKTIESAGVRRGAMMGTLRCDHPDIELFIDAKRDPLRLRNFNVSVLVTDAFMTAVKDDLPWPLMFCGKLFKTISASELWQKIMRSAYETAEPGVIFIDRINETNNLAYCETISSTNPCAEQPLPPNGACLLGSINLAAFVRNPFEDDVYMAEHDIVNTVKLAVRMMDNVIDVSNYPLDAQRQEAQHKRRIGLGITGLADALAMCGLHYGTPEACNTAAVWMKTINSVAYETSLSLAAEKGKFPAFSEKMGNAYYPERRNGQALRNGTLTSIAPTGTISLLAGNISSGIEPMYDWEYERKVKQPDGSMKSVEVEDFAVRLYRQKFSGKPLPSQFWARAHDLSPRQHLNMQAALQRYVDSSISKTVNCPEDMSFEDFEQLYLEAYDMGLKACAAFRPNPITGSILSTGGGGRSPEVHAAPFKEELIVGKDFMEGENQRARYRLAEGPMVELTTPGGGLTATGKKELIELVNKAAGSPFVITPREPVMKGRTHKIKWGAHAIYITINDREDGTPYEIFINSKHSEHYAWSVALTRMISAVWRLHPGDTGFIIEELKAIHDPRGGAWMGGRYIPSVQAAMGYVIDAHLNGKDNGFELHPEVPETDPSTLLNFPHWGSCPGCGSANVYFPKRGCLTCRDCGFSNCNE